MSREVAAAVRGWLEHKQRIVRELAGNLALRPALERLRRFQSARLAASYADLRADPRHAAAIEFFLSDVYGPHEFDPRDAELQRAWRLMEKALPLPAMEILRDALELEVLTLELDSAVAAALGAAPIDGRTYADAYRAIGRRAARERQIELVVDLASRLARVVRHVWIGRLLRLARGPAEAAGFGVLQSFLERGFAAFRSLGDPSAFIAAIDRRERDLTQRLFAGEPLTVADPQLGLAGVAGGHGERR